MPSPPEIRAATSAQPAGLRRLDWRFLLPQPPAGQFRHLRLYGGPPGLADLIVAAKLAARVTGDDTGGQPDAADAVVILGDSQVSLAQAAAGLTAGGVLYQEIARRSVVSLRLTPGRIRQRLEHAGLALTGLYWAAPNFETCRRYIPLDAPGAVRWYLSSLFVAGTPVHRLARALLQAAVNGHSHRLGWFVPCLSVTAIAGSAGTMTDVPAPSVLSRPEIRRLLPQPGLRPLVLTSGQDDASRLVMLPFAPCQADPAAATADQTTQPIAIIKIATHPAFNAATELEQVVLQTVRARLDPPLRRSIPAALGGFRYGDLAVGVEGIAPGRSLWVSSGGWGTSPTAKIADLTLGARWLTAFHAQTEERRLVWDQAAIANWIDAPLAAYAQAQSLTTGEHKLFALTLARAHSLVGATLPLAWQHHDFAPWNIYRAGDQFTVIDWEFNRGWDATRAGPGLCDLLYFVTHWYIIAHHLYTEAAELRGLHSLFLDPARQTRTLRAARRALADYLAAHAIDRGFLPLLLVHTWVERAVYGRGGAQTLDARAGANRAADRCVRYIQTFADQAEQLFSAAHVDRLLE